jgi:hypothetical protein
MHRVGCRSRRSGRTLRSLQPDDVVSRCAPVGLRVGGGVGKEAAPQGSKSRPLGTRPRMFASRVADSAILGCHNMWRSLPQSGFCATSSQLDVLVTPSEAGSVLQLLEGSSMRAHTKDRDYARPASGIGPPKWTGGQNRERDRDKRSSGADQVRPSA